MVTITRTCLVLASLLWLAGCTNEEPEFAETGRSSGEAPASTNVAPLITSTAVTSAREGVPYRYQLVVDDPDDLNNGSALRYSLITAPAGMQVGATGEIRWTPPNGVTSAPVRVRVADGGENGPDAV